MTSSIPTVEEIKAMTVQEHKVLENRIRRAAARQGLRLEKSRARDQRAVDHGTYRLVDQRSNRVVKQDWDTPRGYGLHLHDVARFLFEDINVVVYRGPDHEIAEWLDKNNPNDDPVLCYRDSSTTRSKLPDGWVLTYNGNEYIVGAWDDADEAIAKAQEYLREMQP